MEKGYIDRLNRVCTKFLTYIIEVKTIVMSEVNIIGSRGFG